MIVFHDGKRMKSDAKLPNKAVGKEIDTGLDIGRVRVVRVRRVDGGEAVVTVESITD